MVWTKGKALFSGKCGKCDRTIEKGETVYSNIEGFIPDSQKMKAICEQCFQKYYANEKVVSQMGLLFRRMTLRTK